MSWVGGRGKWTNRAVHYEDEVQEEQTEVPWAERAGEHEEERSDHDDWHRIHVEPEAVAHFVRDEAMSQRIEDCEHIRRCT